MKKLKKFFRQLKPSRSKGYFKLKVISESHPAPDCKLIELEIPTDLKEQFQWKAGQYITLNISLEGKNYLRDYSICNLSGEDYIQLCVKQTPNGLISKQLVSNPLKGTEISVSTPKGIFTLPIKPNEKRTIVGFAAGSGITPIYSILQNVLKNEPHAQFYLFYGNKNPESTIFLKEITQFKDEYKERFHPYFFYSQQETENPIFTGRIDEKKIDLIINQVLDWDEVDEILICGPNELSTEIRQTCIDRGMHASQIHMELFTPIQQKKKSKKDKDLAPVSIRSTYQGKTNEIVWSDFSRSMLDALLDQDIEVPYSCKGGVCGTCVCQLNGKAEMGEQLSLLDSEIEEGRFLPCVSFSAEGSIELNFDDA